MNASDSLPSYRELTRRSDAPPGSSWGLFGADDQRGTLNHLSEERALAATRLVRRGAVFPLHLPLDEPSPHMNHRGAPRHHMLRIGHQQRGHQPGGFDDLATGHLDRDDYLDGFWLQGSSQWDGLGHVRHPLYGNYNFVRDDDIHPGRGGKLGVDNYAATGIVGRGVLVDLERDSTRHQAPVDLSTAHAFTVDDVRSALDAQGEQLEPGDVLLVRTGWLSWFRGLDSANRELVQQSKVWPGLDPSAEMSEFLWDHRIAAVASDNRAVECFPTPGGQPPMSGHLSWLVLLGIPLGEYFHLDDLAAACAADGTYSFLFVSLPLIVAGGLGSPAQAVAVK